MNTIEILKSAQIFDTPQGVALGGAYSPSDPSQSLSAILQELQLKLQGLDTVCYQTPSGDYQQLRVLDIDYHTSIADGVNLFLLVGDVELPQDFTPETTIYRAIKPDYTDLSQDAIAASN
jgi:hypothetical protein